MIDTPDLNSYYMIHAAMRRGAFRLSTALAEIEPDAERLRAVRWYTAGVLDELHVHHTIEDDVFFPALAERVPAFVEYEATLAADHRHLTDVMSGLRMAVQGLHDGQDWDENRSKAVALSAELARFLDEHLRVEDHDILPLFARHFSTEEYHVLDQQAIKRTGLRQLLFTVPWAVTTADREAAEHLLMTGPAVLKIIWRLTRNRHARLATLALGTEVTAVVR
jgi:hemerythrin-like domain-containing protein